jgi:RNA polymerase sigma-70 factor (ECF subfamily)
MAGQPNADFGAQQQPRSLDASHPSPASALAAEIKGLVEQGQRDEARDRFGALVALLQRRALRIAFQYLRDAADADEAVQDAFVKVFLHIEQYRSDLPFDVWFTRILVNAALDRLKARGRQQRWISHSTDEDNGRPVEQIPAGDASHERRLLAKERWEEVTNAVAALPDRQRLVFTLCHLDERTPAEISAATGMSQATVRVHLFRALRKLRGVLGGKA